ncbi:hypothetical protein CFBP2533_09730 [Xanthomonas hortorum pv. pelargonii]|uniref:Uncharacterized protein n=1 Tax=Xanthomonas hortorum pv. pelargonii TaxID=453602 RepID=A0A6V7C635_9XANT|nr:hypothetical protein CFBP2533_09730 [Xanthomonas hortorum pv. pelargonii]CAD0310054.1 hypothetical protein CFBP2533_09730 [Xanthomonas hortorum pv. pelargonii]
MALAMQAHAPVQLPARVVQMAAMSVMSFMSFETFGGP